VVSGGASGSVIATVTTGGAGVPTGGSVPITGARRGSAGGAVGAGPAGRDSPAV
jgi:hypothetical protein